MPAGYAGIHGGIVDLLDATRQAAARSVNARMTASYWEIGRRIVEAEQQGKRRAGYGEQLIEERLASDLTRQFGRGFSRLMPGCFCNRCRTCKPPPDTECTQKCA